MNKRTEYMRKWVEKNKEKHKKYQVSHLDMFRKGNRKWYRKNREYCLEYFNQRRIKKLLN